MKTLLSFYQFFPSIIIVVVLFVDYYYQLTAAIYLAGAVAIAMNYINQINMHRFVKTAYQYEMQQSTLLEIIKKLDPSTEEIIDSHDPQEDSNG